MKSKSLSHSVMTSSPLWCTLPFLLCVKSDNLRLQPSNLYVIMEENFLKWKLRCRG